jgi:hypothetical protein
MPKTSPKNIIATMNVLLVFLAIIGDDVSAIMCRSSECLNGATITDGAIITDVESNGRRHGSAYEKMSHSKRARHSRETIGIQPCSAPHVHERRDSRP